MTRIILTVCTAATLVATPVSSFAQCNDTGSAATPSSTWTWYSAMAAVLDWLWSSEQIQNGHGLGHNDDEVACNVDGNSVNIRTRDLNDEEKTEVADVLIGRNHHLQPIPRCLISEAGMQVYRGMRPRNKDEVGVRGFLFLTDGRWTNNRLVLGDHFFPDAESGADGDQNYRMDMAMGFCGLASDSSGGNPVQRVASNFNRNPFATRRSAVFHELGHAIYNKYSRDRWFGQSLGNDQYRPWLDGEFEDNANGVSEYNERRSAFSTKELQELDKLREEIADLRHQFREAFAQGNRAAARAARQQMCKKLQQQQEITNRHFPPGRFGGDNRMTESEEEYFAILWEKMWVYSQQGDNWRDRLEDEGYDPNEIAAMEDIWSHMFDGADFGECNQRS